MVILPSSHSRDENYQEASFVDAIMDVDAASLAALASGNNSVLRASGTALALAG
jgi:hypothetical protein